MASIDLHPPVVRGCSRDTTEAIYLLHSHAVHWDNHYAFYAQLTTLPCGVSEHSCIHGCMHADSGLQAYNCDISDMDSPAQLGRWKRWRGG